MLGAVDQARIGEQITHLQVQRVEHVLVVAAAEGLEPGRAVTLFEDPELAPLAAARAVGVVPLGPAAVDPAVGTLQRVAD